jgi:uncharacterized membrane protein
MPISTTIYLYLISVPVFALIDFTWLIFIARKFYVSQIGYLLGPVQWPAAIGFYLIFLLGLMYFAILPAIESGAFTRALILGALFGFFTYATYDLTNLATVKDWPLLITFVDMAWGTILGASVSGVMFLIHSRFFA